MPLSRKIHGNRFSLSHNIPGMDGRTALLSETGRTRRRHPSRTKRSVAGRTRVSFGTQTARTTDPPSTCMTAPCLVESFPWGRGVATTNHTATTTMSIPLIVSLNPYKPTHRLLDILQMGTNVIQYVVFDRPSEKIQLTDRCLNHRVLRIIKVNSVPSAKRVELAFGICLELALVRLVHIEPSARSRMCVDDLVFSAVIRNKPVNHPQRNRRTF